MKELIANYNVKVGLIGTAIVLSSVFGTCSYNYETGEVKITTDPAEVVEVLQAEDDTSEDLTHPPTSMER